MILFKFMERGLGLISTMILARVLVPADFGVIAMAMSIVFALELLNSFSFDTVLIQKQNADDVHYNTAWSFKVIFGLLGCTGLSILASPAAGFYDEPALESIIYFLAFGTLIEGLGNIGIVEFRKQLRFDKEFQFLLTKKLVGFCVTLSLAFYLGNYWALVIGILTLRVTGCVMSYVVHPYRPTFSFAAWRELFSFSIWLFINNLLYFVRVRSADFIVGKISGAKGLGVFSVSYEIGELPTMEIISPINRAVFPGYSKISDNLELLRDAYLNVVSMVALVALPAGAGVAAIAELLIPVFLGSKWLDTIPLIKILAFHGAITAMQVNIASVYLALSRPRILTWLSCANAVTLLPVLFFLSFEYGPKGAAWAYLISSAALIPLNYLIMFKTLRLPVRSFIDTVWRPVLATTGMFFIVQTYTQSIYTVDPKVLDIFYLIVGIILGAVSYILLITGLWLMSAKPAGAEQHVLDLLLSRLRLYVKAT
jgi:lipopolysaccharide exporter